ncbi:MAG: hypothetical protein GVY24_04945 [Planctomycetes bacterium]|jgi:hypothetical protein|nr:hypothetical protein [Planctomycetota bacterium]
MTKRDRTHQVVLLVSLPLLAWLVMMVFHEAGHVLGAWLTGGDVRRVVLHPLAFSRTDVNPNPAPGVVVWAGPIVGVALPLSIWLLAAWRRLRVTPILRFIAGFCLLANGAYLAGGSFDRVGDAGDMLRTGTPIVVLWVVGGLAAASGLALWHRQGKHFGLGRDATPVPVRQAYGCVLALMLIAVGMWGWSLQ